METVTLDLRAILAELAVEARKEKATKRWLSHALAKRFMDSLVSEGVKILETGAGNANYFCAEIAGTPVAVSPFGSHEEFWEKLSDGFKSLVAGRRCKWGVVLFVLPERKGFWIEGNDYETKVLQDRQKVHSLEVRRAEKAGIAHPFFDSGEFLRLIVHGPRSRPKAMLIKKGRHA